MTTSLHLVITFDNARIDGASAAGATMGIRGAIDISHVDWRMSVERIVQHGYLDDDQERITVQPAMVTLKKSMDRSSLSLMSRAEKRAEFDSAVLHFFDWHPVGDMEGQQILEMHMTEGRIEEMSIETASSERSVEITETLKLSFKSFTMTHKPANGHRVRTPQIFDCPYPSVRA